MPAGPARLTARIRTIDGKTHTVPVDLSAVSGQRTSGVFESCDVYRRSGSLNADSQLVAGGVQLSLDLPSPEQAGANTIAIAITRTGLSCVAVPRHSTWSALTGIGLAIGDDSFADPYLPLLVARAVGRECASRGK